MIFFYLFVSYSYEIVINSLFNLKITIVLLKNNKTDIFATIIFKIRDEYNSETTLT